MIKFILQIILFIAILVCIGFGLYDPDKEQIKFSSKCFTAIIPLVLWIATMCITFVPANNVGVKWSAFGGTSEKVLSEGLVFKTPFDKVFMIPTTVQERTMQGVTVQTKDAQFLTMEVNVKFNVNRQNAFNVYKRYETVNKMSENIISNYAQKAVETVVTQYNIIDVLGEKKNEVYNLATKELTDKLSAEGVDLVEITIKDMDAGDEIENAIKAQTIAQKETETAMQKKETAKINAETKLIEAEGESKANAAKSSALTDEILKEQWINKWSGNMPQVVGEGGSVFIGLDDENK